MSMQQKHTILWCWNDTNQRKRRVWREDWPDDSFEIFEPAAFVQLIFVCTTFGIADVKEAEDDD